MFGQEQVFYTADQVEVDVSKTDDHAWIDVSFHDDTLPESVPTVVGHLGLTVEQAIQLRNRLDNAILRATS